MVEVRREEEGATGYKAIDVCLSGDYGGRDGKIQQ